MLTKSILAATVAALTLSLTAPAFANPGTDQLALGLGVAPGAYSVAQLLDLQEARRENDSVKIAFILKSGNDVSARADQSVGNGPVSAGAAQLANLLGVAPGVYSVNELTALQTAMQEDDQEAIRFILSNANRDTSTSNDRGVVTPGKVQLAATLGVDPSAYTTAELALLYSAEIQSSEF